MNLPVRPLVALLACASALAHLRPAHAADAADATPPALLSEKGCVACHDVSVKKVGPAFKDVASKYAHQKGATERLTQKVLNGGSGVWGTVAMPPNKDMGVSPAEAKQLVTWVLSLHSGTSPTGNKSR